MKNFLIACLAFIALAVAGCGDQDKDNGDEAPIEQTFLAVGGIYELAGWLTSDAWTSAEGTCETMSFPTAATVVFLQGEDEDGLLTNRVTYVNGDTIVEGLLDEAANFSSVFDNDPYTETSYSGMFWDGGDGQAWRYHGESHTPVPAEQTCSGVPGWIDISLEGERDYYHSP